MWSSDGGEWGGPRLPTDPVQFYATQPDIPKFHARTLTKEHDVNRSSSIFSRFGQLKYSNNKWIDQNVSLSPKHLVYWRLRVSSLRGHENMATEGTDGTPRYPAVEQIEIRHREGRVPPTRRLQFTRRPSPLRRPAYSQALHHRARSLQYFKKMRYTNHEPHPQLLGTFMLMFHYACGSCPGTHS